MVRKCLCRAVALQERRRAGRTIRLGRFAPSLMASHRRACCGRAGSFQPHQFFGRPVFYFGLAERPVDGGIMITASHNPSPYNGMKLFSHEHAQQQWASVDYRKNMSIIGLVQRGGFQEIVAIGSYADEGTGRAEVAFVVREDFQGLGVTSHMLPLLEVIAKENKFQGFVATVLKENRAMMRVFKKRYPNAIVDTSSALDNTIIMDFT